MKKNIVSIATIATLVGTLGFGVNVAAEEVTVTKGDTLWSIANKHQVEVNQLKSWNNLSSNLIHPGDRLQVTEEEIEDVNPTEQYTIQPGDTLSSISRKFDGITVANLQDWNEIANPHVIVAGTTLTINGTKEQKQENTSTTEKSQSSNEEVAKELTMTATAYTASCNGCTGITATGLNLIDNPDKKVISVDPVMLFL
ncbi:cell wall-binding protein [Halalkalibacter wakoensis JCM 9140]|uniref:Cell wall-binding protein n=1 Tax=Halalkalibacter wakoensis JCM 9140 TaxID=1236970 RepID=W4Q0L1_9BACI|nr:cell wall-binding protein [Halalkalibacter wakoensis JCM 9140]